MPRSIASDEEKVCAMSDSPSQKQSGVTLVELLTVLSISALLAFLAVPGYNNLLGRTQSSTQSNDLLADMRYARAEAASRGTVVSMCPSSDAAICSTGTGAGLWSAGRLIFVDSARSGQPASGSIIKKTGAFRGNSTVAVSGFTSLLSFDPYGALLAGTVAIGNGWFKICNGAQPRGTQIRFQTSVRPSASAAVCP
jgi:prepilin-type N-terminal cleavage/methylation domain-containing protein